MPRLKTYQDGTTAGTFSQLNYEDGSKMLISLTQGEIALFKVGFLGIPSSKLWSKSMSDYLDVVYPNGPDSDNYGKQSVLHFSVDKAMAFSTANDAVRAFQTLDRDALVSAP